MKVTGPGQRSKRGGRWDVLTCIGRRTDEHVGEVFEHGPAGHQRHVASSHHQSTQLITGRLMVDHHVTTRAVRQIHLHRRLHHTHTQWLKWAGTHRNCVPGPCNIGRDRSGAPNDSNSCRNAVSVPAGTLFCSAVSNLDGFVSAGDGGCCCE